MIIKTVKPITVNPTNDDLLAAHIYLKLLNEINYKTHLFKSAKAKSFKKIIQENDTFWQNI